MVKVGDRIRMNARANSEYSVTREGGVGTVLDGDSGGYWDVKFDACGNFVVHERFFDVITESGEEPMNAFNFGDKVIVQRAKGGMWRVGDVGIVLSGPDWDGDYKVYSSEGDCEFFQPGDLTLATLAERGVTNETHNLRGSDVAALNTQIESLRQNLADADKVIDSLRTQLEMTQIRFNKALDLLSRDQLAELIAKIITNL